MGYYDRDYLDKTLNEVYEAYIEVVENGGEDPDVILDYVIKLMHCVGTLKDVVELMEDD